MINYEDFYGAWQTEAKPLKDSLNVLTRLFRKMQQEVEAGDVKGLEKDIAAMKETAESLSQSLASLEETASSFNSQAYLESGDFERQMLEECREHGVDVRGESEVYEMVPYRVRLDAANQDIYLDRKRMSCMRPKSFVELVRKSQEKLNRASFNAQAFLTELAGAYDLAILKGKKNPGADVYLTNLYKFLTPMGRFRRDYDQQNFAYDLARLYAAREETETRDGRKFQFGPSRKSNKSIRILDQEGQEQFLATIRFYT